MKSVKLSVIVALTAALTFASMIVVYSVKAYTKLVPRRPDMWE